MEPNSSSLFSLTIDPVTKANLTEAAKWARFLAIAGMVVLVLALFVSIGSIIFLENAAPISPAYDMSLAFGNAMKVGMMVGSIIMLVVAFFPMLFLLRFANNMRSALRSNDQQQLNASFQNLKIYFRYIGIILLIVLVIYGIAITFTIIGAAAAFSTR